MTYYLVINKTMTFPIGSMTLGGTMLAENGWDMVQEIIKNYEELAFDFKVIDDNSKTYRIDTFIEMMSKIKIIKQRG